MEDRLRVLELRLASAERTARSCRRLAVAALAVCAGVLALSPKAAETARKGTRLKSPVEIVDDEGVPRITLAASREIATIAIIDQNQNTLARLGYYGTAYDLGGARIGKPWGGGILQLHHSTGKEAAQLSAVPDGTSLRLWRPDGKPQISAFPGDVSSGFSIYSGDGKRAVDLGTWEPDGAGRLRLLADEKPVLLLGPGPDGAGQVTTYPRGVKP
jgi:hypothetical protein